MAAGQGRRAGWMRLILVAGMNILLAALAGLSFRHSSQLLAMSGLAWLLGLRHAFDVDHVAVIDNSVRKLVGDKKPASSAGFFFSLGHSTIVCAAACVVAAASGPARVWIARVHGPGGLIGTAVSGLLLLAIGLANAVTFWRLAKQGFPIVASPGGIVSRLLRPLSRLITRQEHLYPVGVLFGLGFDTASEIALLGLAAGTGGTEPVRIGSALLFAALFTAGMVLVDGADSLLMALAYRGGGGSTISGRRRYTLVMTGISVAAALYVGISEMLQLASAAGASAWLGSAGGIAPEAGFVLVTLMLLLWAAGTLPFVRLSDARKATADGRGR